ncbi:hypothetical protein Tco_1375790 [Tanacetum coccineum]
MGHRVERAATTAASLDAEQDNGNILKTQSTEIPNVPLSQEIGTGGSPRCQEAMGGTIAQTRSKRVPTPSYDSPLLGGNTSGSDDERLEHQDDLIDFVPPTPHDLPLLGGYTPGSDEGRPNINELMAICTNLSNRVLALETSKTAQDLVINKLKKKVKRLEKKRRARTPGKKLFKIGTSRRKSLDKENVSKQGRNLKIRPMFKDGDFDDDIDDRVNEAIENVKGDTVNVAGTVNTATTGVSAASASVTTAGISISTAEPRTPPTTTTTAFEDKDLTIAQTLVKIRSEKAKPPKNPIKAQIQKDAKIAQRLFEEEQAQIDADELLAERLQQEEREQFTIEEKSRMLVEMIVKRKRFFAAQRAKRIRNKPPTRAQLRNKMKWINDFVPIDSEVVKDSRKGKAEGNRKKTVARKRTGEKLNDESVKRQKIEDDAEKEELRAYLDIIPGDDEAINVESLATKYPIVDWKTHALSEDKMYYEIIRGDGKRFKTASPEGYNKLLWGDIITVFEPSEDDDIWKAQQDCTLMSCRLFDSCGVHVLLMDTRIAIHMLIEKTYPLTQEMLLRMLSRRLEVDHECKMAYELLRGGLLGIRGFYDLMLLVQVCAAAEDKRKTV